MIKFLFYLMLNINTYSFRINKPEKNIVVLHLEKFNPKYNLLHIGISFNNNKELLRYDYRSYNQDKTYRTTDIERLNQNIMFPDLMNSDEYKILLKYSNFINNKNMNTKSDNSNTNSDNSENNDNSDDSYIMNYINTNKKDIYWGITNKTQKEIIEYEKNYLIKKKYKIGIYDCRHYVNEFSIWALNKPTPIWKLKNLWDNN